MTNQAEFSKMDRSFAETVSFECPQCGRHCEPDIWVIVDAESRPDLVERLTGGSLRQVACPGCARESQADSPLLVFQAQREPYLISTASQQTTEEQAEEQAVGLVSRLHEMCGGEWRDEWITNSMSEGLPELGLLFNQLGNNLSDRYSHTESLEGMAPLSPVGPRRYANISDVSRPRPALTDAGYWIPAPRAFGSP
jgi:hypothetical protein